MVFQYCISIVIVWLCFCGHAISACRIDACGQDTSVIKNSQGLPEQYPERTNAKVIRNIAYTVNQDSVNSESNKYYVMVDIGLGLTQTISSLATPSGEYTTSGFNSNLRLTGSNNRLLSFGVETGYQFISSNSQRLRVFGTRDSSDFTGQLYGMPVMAVLGIKEYGLALHVGFGYYRLSSRVTFQNETFTNSEWDQAYSGSLAYLFPLGYRMYATIEGRFVRLVDRQKSLYSINAHIVFPLFRFF